MTREEAKDYIREWCPYDRQEEIIKALEQEPCDKCVYSTSEGCQYDDITETIPPFDDCISRQAVMEYYSTGEIAHCNHISRNNLLDFIEQLPPVTPQPKTGHWIFVHPLQEDDEGAYCCSVCGNGDWGIDPERDKYCYNCGAKMTEGSGEE